MFRDSYEDAWRMNYRDLEPANLYNVDYSLLGTARVEPLIRRIRQAMAVAGLEVENSKGECNLGQHEINFRYADALRCADDHSIYKNGAKEIAAQEGVSISFIAKYNEREGNSCHIHFSLSDAEGRCSPVIGPCSTRSSPASSPACASSRCCWRRTSTPTSAMRRGPSPRRPSRGRSTTGPARCEWSATAPDCASRTGPAAPI